MAELYELTFAKTSGTVTRTKVPRNHCKVRYNRHSKYGEYLVFVSNLSKRPVQFIFNFNIC